MSKQIKLGFDKVPAPLQKSFVPLYDINSGTPLRDNAGNILYTNEQSESFVFLSEDSSAPVHINNGSDFANINNLAVEEQFAITSEVSSSILGVPRAELQLSLFSDVSTYGINTDDWDYYTFNSPLYYPSEWYNRVNPIHGERTGVEFKEYTEEQALAFRAYPVQYSFPFGPKWGGVGRYNENTFVEYIRFIAIGKLLYNYFFINGYEKYAENNFLGDFVTIVDSNDQEIPISQYGLNSNGFFGDTLFYDVKYDEDNFQYAMDQIERFTQTYTDIINQEYVSPFSGFNSRIDLYQGILETANITRLGQSNISSYYGILQSQKSYRYQPGRISGFTFGVRAKTTTESLSNIIEWGASNDTDQYMFQIKGSQFNIVRRSTISLFNGNPGMEERLGFSASEEKSVYVNDLNNSQPLYELNIPRSRFNGDSLDGNGPSGYILDNQNVTMYKIEFGWYGAIGAKFYAYIPTGNDGARWVLIHTLVIENGLGQPCLKNPEFKFKYSMYIRDTQYVNEPMYIYKYGASYYIDGGDEGTLKINSVSSDTKTFDTDTGIIALMPKEYIYNSDGFPILNKSISYPNDLEIRTTEPVKINLKEIICSPSGQHYCYNPSLHNQINTKSREVTLLVNETRDRVTIQAPESFTEEDDYKKIISDGLYNCYIKLDQNSVTTGEASILRKSRQGDLRYQEVERELGDLVQLTDGTELDPSLQLFSGRLTGGNDALLASPEKISSNKFKIHWLNPISRDPSYNNRHFSDFRISVTDKEPAIVTVVDPETSVESDELRFGINEEKYDIMNDRISMHYSHDTENLNKNGAEYTEWGPGYGTKYDIDPRLPNPNGSDTGKISELYGEVKIENYTVTDVQADSPFTRLYFQSSGLAPSISENDVGYINIGVNGQITDIIVESVLQSETVVENLIEVTKYYYLVSGDTSSISNGTEIQVKLVSLESNFLLNSTDPSGNPLFSYKFEKQQKNLKFESQYLYPIIGMYDYAKINGIVIEELIQTGNYSYSPTWITSSVSVDELDNPISYVVNSGNSSSALTPTNFNDVGENSYVRFDTQTTQPLRPGTTVYTTFADQNIVNKINMNNIFGSDRKYITRGLRNNIAYVFSASDISASGDISLSVTMREQ